MNNKERIVEATITLTASHGLSFTVDELAEYLGVSKKTIYQHFSSKEAIIEQVLADFFNEIHEAQHKIFKDESISCKNRLIGMLTLIPRKGIDFRLAYELKKHFPSLHQIMTQKLEEGWAPVLAIIEKGIKSKEFKNINIQVLKEMLLSTMKAIMSDDFLLKSDLTYQEAFRSVMDIVLGGITNPIKEKKKD